MKKKLKMLTVCSVIASMLMATVSVAQAEEAEEPEPTGELVLYTSFPQARKEQLVDEFEAETGINVTLVEGGTSDILARAQAEIENPQGDFFIGGMVPAIYQANTDLFQEYTSVNNDLYPEEYQVVDGKFGIYSLEPSIIAVNTDLMEENGFTEDQLDSYEDMLNPDLKGLLVMADPTQASTGYEHLVNMLVDMGDPEDDYAAGWDYVRQLLEVATVVSSSGAVSEGVSEGEYMVGLSYESTICNFWASGYPVAIEYMEEGVIFGCNGAGILAGCKNLYSAQQMMDFLLSKEFSDMESAEPIYLRTIIGDVPDDAPYAPYDSIQNAMAGDPDYFEEEKAEVLDKYMEIYQEVVG